MPTIPLYNPDPPDADAWHDVTAPGGYEWWYFDADDTENDLRIVAVFFDGCAFHPGYLRRYARYCSHPTTNRPPRPRQYPCVQLAVYRGGQLAAQFSTQYPAEHFTAASDRPLVTIGPNSMLRDQAGNYQLSLIGFPGKGAPSDETPPPQPWPGVPGEGRHNRREPIFPDDLKSSLVAKLSFTPTANLPPTQRRFLSKAMAGAEHFWVLAAPMCQVSGTIDLPNRDGSSDTLNFTGGGYHDHNYGSGPIGPGLARWIWGRVLLRDRTLAFHFARPSRPQEGHYVDEVQLVEANADGLIEHSVMHSACDLSLLSGALIAYPAEIEINALRLINPRLIDSTPFFVRLIYDATGDGFDSATAYCQVMQPSRLRWPVLGRWIERSIQRDKWA